MGVRSMLGSVVRGTPLEPAARALLAAVRNRRELASKMANMLGVAKRAIPRLANSTSTAIELQRLGQRYRSTLRRHPPIELLRGTTSTDQIAIVVCLWNRPERIVDVLRILDSQNGCPPLRLVLWNNQPADSQRYREQIAQFSLAGSLQTVQFVDSGNNIGGIGRFVVARQLVRSGYTGPFIMMDDDQDFGSGFVRDLLSVYGPRSIAGVWAWTNKDHYWNRQQVVTTGARADHVGTGGSIADSALVTDDAFFRRLPMRFLFMEDIWMSRYALHNGWTLTMVDSPFEFVSIEKDQGHALFDRKEDLYDWLSDPAHIPVRDVQPV